MEQADVGRRAIRSAREMAHLATSIASEAANLTRALESYGAMHASVAASQASIRAAQGAFIVDEVALSATRLTGADLQEVFLKTEACLDAAEQAIEAARSALRAASSGVGLSNGDAMGDS